MFIQERPDLANHVRKWVASSEWQLSKVIDDG
jgi:hypothetical protein